MSQESGSRCKHNTRCIFMLNCLFSVLNTHSRSHKVSKNKQKPTNSVFFITELEIRSVERGICHIATSTMNELFSYTYGA